MMCADSLSTLRNNDCLDSIYTSASFSTLEMVILHHFSLSRFKPILLFGLMELPGVKLLPSFHPSLNKSCLKTRNYELNYVDTLARVMGLKDAG